MQAVPLVKSVVTKHSQGINVWLTSTTTASLRQADAARKDFAQLMDLAFTPLRVMLGSAVLPAGFGILWTEAFWRHCF